MNLIDSMSDKCVLMDRTTIADGEGGYVSTWTEGAEISVAITLDTSMNTRIAESEGFTNSYTLTSKTKFGKFDVIKRVSDGLILRVTNDNKEFPKVASENLKGYYQVSAEKWELTT